MEIRIRQAGAQDVALLVEWRMEVMREVFGLADDPGDRFRSASLEYYRSSLANGTHVAALAEADGETAGCGGLCLYREMPSPDNPSGQCAYLMNIYTKRAYRGNGIGERTVRYLIGEARSRGITKIFLESTKAARPFYEKIGFEDMVDYMMLWDDAEG